MVVRLSRLLEPSSELSRPWKNYYKHNYLSTVDTEKATSPTQVTNARSMAVLTNASGGVVILEENLKYKLVVPFSGNMSEEQRYNNVLYQDKLRSFYLEEKDAARQQYSIHAIYHPFTREFLGELGSGGLERLYTRETQYLDGEDLNAYYQPNSSHLVPEQATDIIREQVNFENYHGYGIYNQEIFFHIPLMIATELSENQRFEEAMQWFHFIFNPIGVPYNRNTAGSEEVSRYWITKPFFEQTNAGYQENLIQNLLGGQLSEETRNAINVWRKNPFMPYAIARMRPVAYQKAVVMKYIDNLVAWGDQLFRRETLESINQAALRYIMAAEILGDQPNILASKKVNDQDYATIKDTLDEFSNGNLLVQLENWTINTNGSNTTSNGAVPESFTQGNRGHQASQHCPLFQLLAHKR